MSTYIPILTHEVRSDDGKNTLLGTVVMERERSNHEAAKQVDGPSPFNGVVRIRDAKGKELACVEFSQDSKNKNAIYVSDEAVTATPVLLAGQDPNMGIYYHDSLKDDLAGFFDTMARTILGNPQVMPHVVAMGELQRMLNEELKEKLAEHDAAEAAAPAPTPAPTKKQPAKPAAAADKVEPQDKHKDKPKDPLQGVPWYSAVVPYNAMQSGVPEARLGRMSFRREAVNAQMAEELGGLQTLVGDLRIENAQGTLCAVIRFTKDGALYSDAERMNVPLPMSDGGPVLLVADDKNPKPIHEMLEQLSQELLQALPVSENKQKVAGNYLAGRQVHDDVGAGHPDVLIDTPKEFYQPIFDDDGEREVGTVQCRHANPSAARRAKGYSTFHGEVKMCDIDGEVVAHLVFSSSGVCLKEPGDQPVLNKNGQPMIVKYGKEFKEVLEMTATELLNDHSRPALDVVQENLQRLNERVYDKRKGEMLPRLLQRDANHVGRSHAEKARNSSGLAFGSGPFLN